MDLAPHSAVSTPEAQRRAGHQILAALGVPRRQEPQPVRESQASSTFQSLEEMWRTLESLGPMRGPKLEYHEFRGRFLAWVQVCTRHWTPGIKY